MARALLALLLASLTVTVDRPVVMPGEVVTVTIAGYEPGLMFIDTTDELVVLETTKASGSITMRAQIAADAPAGPTFIRVATHTEDVTATVQIVSPALATFGDSITAASDSYAEHVARAWGMQLDNRAVGGTRIAEQRQAAEAWEGGGVAVLVTGYNDMRAGADPETFRADLRATIAALRTKAARVLVAGCLPMTAAGYAAYGPQWSHGSDAAVARLSAIIREEAGADYVPIWYDPRNVQPDLVHPSEVGQAQIARAFVQPYHVFVPGVTTHA